MLTESQIRQFNEEGYLFLPETFSPEEVAILKSEAEADLPPAPPRGLARKLRRAPHRFRRPSL